MGQPRAARLFLPWMRWARRGREDASAGAAREVVGALRPQRILNRMTRARSPGAAIFDTRSGSRAEKESVPIFFFFYGRCVASESSCARLLALERISLASVLQAASLLSLNHRSTSWQAASPIARELQRVESRTRPPVQLHSDPPSIDRQQCQPSAAAAAQDWSRPAPP